MLLLLLTVFSLSDAAVDENIVKTCFEAWIKNDPSIDRTVNQYEASLRRLMDGFLHIVDDRGQRKIGVVNPSVNDYLDARISNDPAEREFLLRNICSIRQFSRLLPKDELNAFIKTKLEKGEVDSIVFDDVEQKTVLISYYVAVFQVRNKEYLETIQAYLKEPSGVFLNDKVIALPTSILKRLINSPLRDYYELENVAGEIDLEWIFEGEELDDIVEMISTLSPLFRGEARNWFIQCSAEAVSDAIDEYGDDVDAANYDPDISGAIELSSDDTEYGFELDREMAAQIIEEEIESRVEEEICALINELPDDIQNAKDYESEIGVFVSGAESLIETFIRDASLDYDRYKDDFPTYEPDEIDRIFER